MCLRFPFLLITRVTAWLRLSRREDAWKTAEISILRHQLLVLQRQSAARPKLARADRALLAALLGVIPKPAATDCGCWSPRTRSCAGTATSSAAAGPPGPSAAGPAGRPPAGPSGPWPSGWPATTPNGATAGSTASWPAWESRSRRRPCGRSSRPAAPAPRRGGPVPAWSQFLRSQADAILACDFFTVDLPGGTQAYALAVIEHATRRIRILGVTLHPTGEWTAQQARNLLMDLSEQTQRVKFMIRDRGSSFTAAFDAVLADAGIRTVLCNVRTPRMNGIAERWIGGCRRELPDRALIWNQHHLRRILRDYETHHNQHRPRRSLHGAAPLKPLPEPVDLEQ